MTAFVIAAGYGLLLVICFGLLRENHRLHLRETERQIRDSDEELFL